MSLGAGDFKLSPRRSNLEPTCKPRLRCSTKRIGVKTNMVPLIAADTTGHLPSITKVNRHRTVSVAWHDPDRRLNDSVSDSQFNHGHSIPAMLAAVSQGADLETKCGRRRGTHDCRVVPR